MPCCTDRLNLMASTYGTWVHCSSTKGKNEYSLKALVWFSLQGSRKTCGCLAQTLGSESGLGMPGLGLRARARKTSYLV